VEINSHLYPKADKYFIDNADIVIIATGISARASLQAVLDAREQGIKAGLYRPITVWPFPEKDIKEIASKADIIVSEMSMGQLIWPVERYARKECTLVKRIGGTPPDPKDILSAIKRIVKK